MNEDKEIKAWLERMFDEIDWVKLFKEQTKEREYLSQFIKIEFKKDENILPNERLRLQ
jgi:hypothetical protein